MGLTKRQERFVEEYLVDLSATRAAVRAGYSTRTAEVIGYENLRKPQIAQKVQEAMSRRAGRVEVSKDSVLLELAKIGFAEAGDAVGAELKYSNKLKALELLGKHLGMFRDKAAEEETAGGGVVLMPPNMKNPGPPVQKGDGGDG